MEEKKFTESDVKEAIRMVLQDWLDNEHGMIATQEEVNEYFKKLLDKTNEQKGK